MSQRPYVWVGTLLAKAKHVFETDPRGSLKIADRIGIDPRHMYRLARRYNWQRPASARVHRRIDSAARIGRGA